MEFANIENLNLDDCRKLLNQDSTNVIVQERYNKLLALKKEEDVIDFSKCKTNEDFKNYQKKYNSPGYKGIFLHAANMILRTLSDDSKFRDKERRFIQRIEDLQESIQWLKRLLFFLTIGFVVLVSIFFIYNKFFDRGESISHVTLQNDSLYLVNKDLKLIISEKDSTINSLNNIIKSVELRNSDIKSQLKSTPLVITQIDVKNVNNGEVISTTNGRLNQSETMYLAPQLTYIGAIETSVSLYFKIKRPDGIISTSTGNEYKISAGKNLIRLRGWGSSDPGYWPAGNYHIEIMYCDKCLYEDTFVVYDDK